MTDARITTQATLDEPTAAGQQRKSGCIEILKVQRGKGDKQAVKAQVRGGRIIWYEYDRKSGRVRRTN